MKETLEYVYRYSAPRLTFGVIMFCSLAACMAYLAHANRAGLRLSHQVSMSPEVTTLIYWAAALLCLVPASMLALSLVAGIAGRAFEIRLTPTEFSAPGSGILRKENITVPLSQIRRVSLRRIYGASRRAGAANPL